jgi:hypothetical protein
MLNPQSQPMTPAQLEAHFAVRPSFRVVGALILALVAWLFLSNVPSLLFADSVALSCDNDTGRKWVCEVSVWILRLFPASAHGIIVALSIAIASAGCLYFGALLLLGLKRKAAR